MKKIYKISNALEGDVTGTTPQVVFESEILEDKVIRKLKRLSVENLKELTFELPNLILNDGAKETHWLNTFSLSMGKGKLISKKLYDFITELRLPEFENIKLNLKNDNYFYFNLKDTAVSEYIDFSKSSFRVIPGHENVRINSSEVFYKEQKKHSSSYIKWIELILKEDIFEEFDLVKIGYGDIDWYISEDLKAKFEVFSGLRVEEVNNITLSGSF